MDASLLRAAISVFGTQLGFYRTYGLSAAMSLLAFENRLRGAVALLTTAQETAIALALVAAAADAAAPPETFYVWSNGAGWETRQPPFSIFPLEYQPSIAPSSLTIPVGGPSYFSYVQSTPSASWTIDHNLGRDPSVIAFGSDYKPISGTVTYFSPNQVVISFSQPVDGTAYLV